MVDTHRILELLMELGYSTVASFEDLDLDGIIAWLENEKESHIDDLRKIVEAIELIEDYKKERDESYIKVLCPYCRGSGYIQTEDHKSLCPLCSGRSFIWAQKAE